MCHKSFTKKFGLITEKHFCHFCMDYVCSKCLSDKKTLIPCEYQLKHTVCNETICKEGYDFLTKFTYIKIDKKNPLLIYNHNLRRLMVLRRKVHKLFDLIKCLKWTNILELTL